MSKATRTLPQEPKKSPEKPAASDIAERLKAIDRHLEALDSLLALIQEARSLELSRDAASGLTFILAGIRAEVQAALPREEL